MKEQRLLSEL